MNTQACDQLARKLIGTTPSQRASLIKGSLTGGLLFTVFEYFSTVNENIPRIPVAWLLAGVTIVIEAVLFGRVISIVRFPRSENLFTVLRMDYRQRTEVALHAIKTAHTAFLPFMISALLIAPLLELLVLKERSLFLLLAVPASATAFLLLSDYCVQLLIKTHRVPPVRRDDAERQQFFAIELLFRELLARVAIPIAQGAGRLVPQSVRVHVKRSALYLLRGELFMSLLILAVVPVFVLIIILMLDETTSPFRIFLPLLALFLVNLHIAADLTESSVILPDCYWYPGAGRGVIAGYATTLLFAAFPFLLIMVIGMAPVLFSFRQTLALMNGTVSLAVIVFTSACRITSFRKGDEKKVSDLAVFAVIALGVFIPYAGIAFTFTAAGLVLLLQWDVITGAPMKKT